MVTCYLRYVIAPYKLAEFEKYAKMWIPLAAYEEYRTKMAKDAECLAAFKYAEETRCIVSYERSFMKPVFEQG